MEILPDGHLLLHPRWQAFHQSHSITKNANAEGASRTCLHITDINCSHFQRITRLLNIISTNYIGSTGASDYVSARVRYNILLPTGCDTFCRR